MISSVGRSTLSSLSGGGGSTTTSTSGSAATIASLAGSSAAGSLGQLLFQQQQQQQQQTQPPRSPFLERSGFSTLSTLSSLSSSTGGGSSYNSATLPSRRARSNASLPSAAELFQLSSTLSRVTAAARRGSRDKLRSSAKRESGASSASPSSRHEDQPAVLVGLIPPPTTIASSGSSSLIEREELAKHLQHLQSNDSARATLAGEPGVCDICSSYGHPWIEICKAIRATNGK